MNTEEGAEEMPKKMSLDDMMEMAKHAEEMRQRRNARRRARRQWLKNAPREETALRYRAQEKPCTVQQYLQAERFLLHWLDEFPDLKGDATAIFLVLAHNVLHLLYPEKKCTGTTLIDCPSFSLHDFCWTACEIAFNFNPDPVFKLTRPQIFTAMIELTEGMDREKLRFNALMGDIVVDL